MRPAVFLTALMGAVGSQADSLIWERAWFSGIELTNRMAWRTDFGQYNIPRTHNSCTYSGLAPGMVELCMDFRPGAGRGRGHFRFSHQSFRRCVIFDDLDVEDIGGSVREVQYFRETACTWPIKRDAGDVDTAANVTVSELPAEPAATPAAGVDIKA